MVHERINDKLTKKLINKKRMLNVSHSNQFLSSHGGQIIFLVEQAEALLMWGHICNKTLARNVLGDANSADY